MAKTQIKKNGIEVQPLLIKIPTDQLAKIDRLRGLDSRTRFINDVIKKVKE